MMACRVEEYVGRKVIDEPECLKDSPISGTYRIELSDEEIIRCRDCRFRSGENNIGVKPDYCTKFAHYRAKLEGFCAWAERTGDKS